ncbi:hypothetical protein BGP77_00220 [Saccharospirillum sp. MSK14-1]|uniref:DUF4180 domain-containing protein n=1 Tax=Saccharospirillum sp. MSK14-1 TaxID=1897632 RepID=UPI000D34B0A3|nr:DUF4180 domain-containing protein [Saccharospirillum sp. MSK14-1]PTY35793.1 hypothetical protein BGP77_00220 [Saccharospirillum sp. MSK14-1]
MKQHTQLASDLIGRAMEHGYLLLDETELPAEFFNLSTGLAGEVMQKFVNYQLPLAIVVRAPSDHGDRFAELVHEHQRHPMIRFFADAESANVWLDSSR